MDSEKSCSSNKYHFKYASSDAIHNPLKKKKFAHVQSKVKVFIDNIKKEDREKRAFKLARYSSEPTELSTATLWEVVPDDDRNEVMESSHNWKLLLQEKDKEVEQMKNYADLMSKMLLNERTESSKLRYQLDEVRVQLHHSRRVTLQTTDYHFDSSESVRNEGDVESDEGGVEYTDNDETLLIQVSPSTVQHKKMKNRLRKLLRCCAPCIKNEEIDKDKEE